MAKKRARNKSKALKKYLGKIRGNTGIMLILLVVVFGGVFMAGGILPKVSEESYDKSQGFVPDETSFQAGGGKDTLKLETLKFKKCSQTTAVLMMLDRSGSMGQSSKLNKLKAAVNAFINNLSDDSVIGISSFDSHQITKVPNVTEDTPVSLYKDVKSTIKTKVNTMNPGGYTPTTPALQFSRDRLIEAQSKFPDRKFSFIFVSDGRPEPDSEHPKYFNPNPIQEIKGLGVTVYSIAIFDRQDAQDPELTNLMREIASSPDNLYIAPTPDELAKIYEQIGTKICGSV